MHSFIHQWEGSLAFVFHVLYPIASHQEVVHLGSHRSLSHLLMWGFPSTQNQLSTPSAGTIGFSRALWILPEDVAGAGGRQIQYSSWQTDQKDLGYEFSGACFQGCLCGLHAMSSLCGCGWGRGTSKGPSALAALTLAFTCNILWHPWGSCPGGKSISLHFWAAFPVTLYSHPGSTEKRPVTAH